MLSGFFLSRRPRILSSGIDHAAETLRLSRRSGPGCRHRHGRLRRSQDRRRQRHRRRPQADPRPFVCRMPEHHPACPRHRGGHALRRRHGQLGSRPQRHRRRTGVCPGRRAGGRRHRQRCHLAGRGVAADRGGCQGRAWRDSLHRPVLRWQRAQPHRSPEGDGQPGQGRGHQDRAHPRPARRPRCAGNQRPRLRGALRSLPGGSQCRRLRCSHRLRRWPPVHHHGPLRRQLADGRKRLEDPRAGRRHAVRQRHRRGERPARQARRHHRPGPAGVRRCRKRQAHRHH